MREPQTTPSTGPRPRAAAAAVAACAALIVLAAAATSGAPAATTMRRRPIAAAALPTVPRAVPPHRTARIAVPPDTSPRRRVALTFDDLPFVPSDYRAGCAPDAVLAMNRRLLDTLGARGIAATGLVVAGQDCGPGSDGLLRSVLAAWLDAGLELGNHTYSHRDLNSVELDWYFGDIERGAAVVDSLLTARGRRLRYFRAPLLHMGDTPEKRRGLEGYLAERGYTIAPVTIDNQEWVYAVVYARAMDTGDDALAHRVVAAYLDHIEEAFAFYERLSRDVFGREIPQVLLLHANRINADHLAALVDRIRRRGYSFVSLDAALLDSAYATPDTYVGRQGLSWIQRWARARGIEVPPEPREAPWVAELFRAAQGADD